MVRALPVILAFIVGVAAGAVGVGVLIPTTTDIGGADGAPAYSYTSATSGAVETVLEQDGGWLHEIHLDERIAVTGNATVAHEADRMVELTVTRSVPGEYRLAFVEGPTETGEKSAEGQVATTIEWGVELPADYDRYVITVDGTVVKTVSNDEATTPRLLRLPHPLA